MNQNNGQTAVRNLGALRPLPHEVAAVIDNLQPQDKQTILKYLLAQRHIASIFYYGPLPAAEAVEFCAKLFPRTAGKTIKDNSGIYRREQGGTNSGKPLDSIRRRLCYR